MYRVPSSSASPGPAASISSQPGPKSSSFSASPPFQASPGVLTARANTQPPAPAPPAFSPSPPTKFNTPLQRGPLPKLTNSQTVILPSKNLPPKPLASLSTPANLKAKAPPPSIGPPKAPLGSTPKQAPLVAVKKEPAFSSSPAAVPNRFLNPVKTENEFASTPSQNFTIICVGCSTKMSNFHSEVVFKQLDFDYLIPFQPKISVATDYRAPNWIIDHEDLLISNCYCLDKGSWMKEDGMVYDNIYCSTCSPPVVIGVKILAADYFRSEYLNKCFIFSFQCSKISVNNSKRKLLENSYENLIKKQKI